MTAWSSKEANRTIDEVKRRSQLDAEFRALALSDPIAALHKVNPRPVPEGAVRFVEDRETSEAGEDNSVLVVLLPPACAEVELDDAELEDVAGGLTSGGNDDPPVGNS